MRANCDYSDLDWIIETDVNDLELITPTFYVKDYYAVHYIYDLLTHIKWLLQENNTISASDATASSSTEITFNQLIINLNKLLNIELQFISLKYDPDKKIITDHDNNYFADNKSLIMSNIEKSYLKTKNDPTDENITNHVWKTINDCFKGCTSIEKINFTIDKKRSFLIEAINLSHCVEDIAFLIGGKDELHTESHLQESILKVIGYDLSRMTYFYINTFVCENKHQTGLLQINSDEKTNILNNINRNHGILESDWDYKTSDFLIIFLLQMTGIKGSDFWCKFDVFDYINHLIKRGFSVKDILGSVIDNLNNKKSEYIVSSTSEIQNFFASQSACMRSVKKKTIFEVWIQKSLVPKYVLVTTNKFDSMIEKLQTINTTGEILDRNLCNDESTNKCGKCVKNYGDYSDDYFGIRHDTYIDNYLVVEYRNPDKFWEVVRFFEKDNPNVLKV